MLKTVCCMACSSPYAALVGEFREYQLWMEEHAKLQVDLTHMADQLPPIIARDSVEQFLGGVISPKYLANLDSLGQGPERMRIGRKIAYRTSDLLTWLSKRAVQLN